MSTPPIFGHPRVNYAQIIVNSGFSIDQRLNVWQTAGDESIDYQVFADGGKTCKDRTPMPGIPPRI